MEKERSRKKRSVDLDIIKEFAATNSPYHIVESIVVRAEQILRIHAGTHLAFAENTGIIVQGSPKYTKLTFFKFSLPKLQPGKKLFQSGISTAPLVLIKKIFTALQLPW